MVHAHIAVEMNTGWNHPHLWKSMHGARTHSCGGVYGVGSPVAVEKHKVRAPTAPQECVACMCQQLRRSTRDACTHSHVEAQRVHAPTAM